MEGCRLRQGSSKVEEEEEIQTLGFDGQRGGMTLNSTDRASLFYKDLHFLSPLSLFHSISPPQPKLKLTNLIPFLQSQ